MTHAATLRINLTGIHTFRSLFTTTDLEVIFKTTDIHIKYKKALKSSLKPHSQRHGEETQDRTIQQRAIPKIALRRYAVAQ